WRAPGERQIAEGVGRMRTISYDGTIGEGKARALRHRQAPDISRLVERPHAGDGEILRPDNLCCNRSESGRFYEPAHQKACDKSRTAIACAATWSIPSDVRRGVCAKAGRRLIDAKRRQPFSR